MATEMTPEQRARLEDAARYPMLAKMEDVKAALAHIDALEARVKGLGLDLRIANEEKALARDRADALAAERDAAKAERLASERQHYDDVARLEAERDALRAENQKLSGWFNDEAQRAGREQARATALVAERDALLMEAQIHAQEARTQRATVHACYRAVTGGTGEPGDWNGAVPVERAIADLKARAEQAERDLGEALANLRATNANMEAMERDLYLKLNNEEQKLEQAERTVAALVKERDQWRAVASRAEAHMRQWPEAWAAYTDQGAALAPTKEEA